VPETSGMESGDSNAFNLLLSDMIERLLSLSDNPKQASAYIAEELRSLIGARTVAVISHLERSGHEEHQVRSVFPVRRIHLVQSEDFLKLLASTHDHQGVRLFDDKGHDEQSMLLRRMSITMALIMPLTYGSSRVGVGNSFGFS